MKKATLVLPKDDYTYRGQGIEVAEQLSLGTTYLVLKVVTHPQTKEQFAFLRGFTLPVNVRFLKIK